MGTFADDNKAVLPEKVHRQAMYVIGLSRSGKSVLLDNLALQCSAMGEGVLVIDHKDGLIGRVGYEVNFNRYFYKYQAPRALEAIEADIRKLEREILDMLRGITQ